MANTAMSIPRFGGEGLKRVKQARKGKKDAPKALRPQPNSKKALGQAVL
jgi:hypothetical protein